MRIASRTLALVLLALAATALLGCNSAGEPEPDDVDSFSPPRKLKVRAGGTDVTFFVAADTHLGYEGMAKLNERQVDAMNALPGTAYPTEIGGAVATPLGVLIAGDLTDTGRNDADAPQWDAFVRLYGRKGGDGRLKYPVYLATGNHDRWPDEDKPVVEAVKRRHGRLTYSWDSADVHLVCLDVCPNAANRAWLQRDLAKIGNQPPVVIFFHYNIEGPFSGSWSDQEKADFARAIEGYNVVGIFHGHWHASRHTKWAGVDVYNVGSPKHAARSFAVVRITDTAMTVASWDWVRGRWGWRHRKSINAAAD